MDAVLVGTPGPNQEERYRHHKYSSVNIHRRLSRQAVTFPHQGLLSTSMQSR